MSVTFLNPQGLNNLKKASICSEFSNNDPVNLKKLYSSSCTLAASTIYYSSGCTGCSPTTHGFYIPKVANQTELTSNFAQLGIGSSTVYMFFKQDENAVWVLYQTSDLATGFEEGVAADLFFEGSKVGLVNETQLGSTLITASPGGGNIIIGVLDTLGED